MFVISLGLCFCYVLTVEIITVEAFPFPLIAQPKNENVMVEQYRAYLHPT